MDINSVNSVQSQVTSGKSESFKTKFFRCLEDSYEVQKKYENTPKMGNDFNIVKFKEKFPDEMVEKLNETRQIPEGYILKYSPKTIIHKYNNGNYTGDNVQPPKFHIYENNKLANLLYSNQKTIDKLPEGYKYMNYEDNTFIVKEEVTPENLSEFIKKGKSTCRKLGIIGIGIVILGLLLKKL